MQCPRLAAAGCLVTLIGSAALSAQAPLPAAERPAAETARLPLKPFSRLFEQQTSDATAALRFEMPRNFARPNSARRFICGIGVLPADPTVDPKFARAPADTATRFTMRIVPMPCR